MTKKSLTAWFTLLYCHMGSLKMSWQFQCIFICIYNTVVKYLFECNLSNLVTKSLKVDHALLEMSWKSEMNLKRKQDLDTRFSLDFSVNPTFTLSVLNRWTPPCRWSYSGMIWMVQLSLSCVVPSSGKTHEVSQVGFVGFLCHVLEVRSCSLFSPLVNV